MRALWSALLEQSVPAAYVRCFARIYEHHVGRVTGQARSKEFNIGRGVRQGDPISPNFFNALLEHVLAPLQENWRRRSWGISFGDGDANRICNLRFADDIILIASSSRQLKRMLLDLSTACSVVGLRLHAGKTKILCNSIARATGHPQHMQLHDSRVEVLPLEDGTMYLGRLLSFHDYHDVELRHRLKRAWAKFHSLREELCSRSYSLKHRLHLLESVVTPTVLYSAGSWTMRTAREKMLRKTQRQMLRAMTRIARQTVGQDQANDSDGSFNDDPGEDTEVDEAELLEPFVDWLRRATHISEDLAQKQHVQDWVAGQRARKWRLAGHTARRTDGRWSTKLLFWTPAGYRNRGRPVTRWADELCDFVAKVYGDGADWRAIAQDRATWNALEEDFVNKAYLAA